MASLYGNGVSGDRLMRIAESAKVMSGLESLPKSMRGLAGAFAFEGQAALLRKEPGPDLAPS